MNALRSEIITEKKWKIELKCLNQMVSRYGAYVCCNRVFNYWRIKRGLVQTLVRSGTLKLPGGIGYYQILTVHGIILALVLTTFFIMGFQTAAVIRTCGKLSPLQRKLVWIGFG